MTAGRPETKKDKKLRSVRSSFVLEVVGYSRSHYGGPEGSTHCSLRKPMQIEKAKAN